MSTLICLHCTAPSTNGVAMCERCRRTALRALGNITIYHADLFSLPAQFYGVLKSKQVADPTGNAVATVPAANPIEDAAAQTKNALVGWVRLLLDDRPQLHYPPIDTVEALAKLIGQQLRTIATLEWAGELVRDLIALELRLRRIVEANKGKWYAGVCGMVLDDETGAFCTRVLYADPDAGDVRCPVCRTTWPVPERRRILLNLARDEVTNVATIARAIGVLFDGETSQARLERRIQNWIDRGDIERRGHLDIDGRVRKVYRVGDVLDMLISTKSGRSA